MPVQSKCFSLVHVCKINLTSQNKLYLIETIQQGIFNSMKHVHVLLGSLNWIFHPDNIFLNLMSFQTCMTFLLLWNIKVIF